MKSYFPHINEEYAYNLSQIFSYDQKLLSIRIIKMFECVSIMVNNKEKFNKEDYQNFWSKLLSISLLSGDYCEYNEKSFNGFVEIYDETKKMEKELNEKIIIEYENGIKDIRFFINILHKESIKKEVEAGGWSNFIDKKDKLINIFEIKIPSFLLEIKFPNLYRNRSAENDETKFQIIEKDNEVLIRFLSEEKLEISKEEFLNKLENIFKAIDEVSSISNDEKTRIKLNHFRDMELKNLLNKTDVDDVEKKSKSKRKI